MRLIGLAVVLALSLALAPLAAEAQPANLPLIAVLDPGSASTPSVGTAHFKRALEQFGWVEGRTVRFETRYGEYQPDRTAAMARELVALKPDVFYTSSDGPVRAAMRATTSIPIVVGAVADLVALGGVQNLARPGGNVTGVTHAQHELDRKRLEVLKEAVPSVSRIAYLFDPRAIPETALRALDESASQLKVRLQRVGVNNPDELEAAFTAIVKKRAQALLVQDAQMLSRYSERVTALALRHRLPSISQIPRFVERGGLLQYGADVFDLFRRSATHVDKILRGAKPGDLPVEQPTKVDLIINLKTAKTLGLTIPQSVLVRAGEIIQ
jgi:putative tryptophan/tyrosine transport system substrate-binding protein